LELSPKIRGPPPILPQKVGVERIRANIKNNNGSPISFNTLKEGKIGT